MHKIIRHIILFVFLVIATDTLFAQQKLDSLLLVLKDAREDTLKVNVYNELFLQYEFEDDVKAADCLKRSRELAQRIGYVNGLSRAFLYAGYFSEDKGNYSEALENYQSSLKVIAAEPKTHKRELADGLICLGNVYNYQGNYPLSLQSYFRALKVYEEIGSKRGIANSHGNIGGVYAAQENYSEALKNHNAALAVYKELNKKTDMAYSYHNIGAVLQAQRKYEEALKNYEISLKLKIETGSKTGMASTYNAIGALYSEICDREKTPEARNQMLELALENLFSSLKIGNEIGDRSNITNSYCNIGIVYIQQKKYAEARDYLMKAKEMSLEMGYLDHTKVVYKAFVALDSATGNFRGAYDNNCLFVKYRDSINNEESRKKIVQSQMNYDFEKKEAVTNAAHQKELENQQQLAEERNHKQQLILIFVLGFLLLLLGFSAFIFKSLKTTRRQKLLIEEQKLVVEEKRKEMIDSITYARRIQQSLLPTEKYIGRNLSRLNQQKGK